MIVGHIPRATADNDPNWWLLPSPATTNHFLDSMFQSRSDIFIAANTTLIALYLQRMLRTIPRPYPITHLHSTLIYTTAHPISAPTLIDSVAMLDPSITRIPSSLTDTCCFIGNLFKAWNSTPLLSIRSSQGSYPTPLHRQLALHLTPWIASYTSSIVS